MKPTYYYLHGIAILNKPFFFYLKKIVILPPFYLLVSARAPGSVVVKIFAY